MADAFALLSTIADAAQVSSAPAALNGAVSVSSSALPPAPAPGQSVTHALLPLRASASSAASQSRLMATYAQLPHAGARLGRAGPGGSSNMMESMRMWNRHKNAAMPMRHNPAALGNGGLVHAASQRAASRTKAQPKRKRSESGGGGKKGRKVSSVGRKSDGGGKRSKSGGAASGSTEEIDARRARQKAVHREVERRRTKRIGKEEARGRAAAAGGVRFRARPSWARPGRRTHVFSPYAFAKRACPRYACPPYAFAHYSHTLSFPLGTTVTHLGRQLGEAAQDGGRTGFAERKERQGQHFGGCTDLDSAVEGPDRAA